MGGHIVSITIANYSYNNTPSCCVCQIANLSTIKEKRKAIEVVSFGAKPFHLDKDGKVYPHGFVARTKALGTMWLAETRVIHPDTPDSAVQFRFVCEQDQVNGCGDWKATATAAFQVSQIYFWVGFIFHSKRQFGNI
jgi:hypothetical protein